MKLIKSLPLIQELYLWDITTSEWIQFKLWPKQVEFLYALHSHRDIIDLKKRQVGASQLCGADTLIQCMGSNFKCPVLSIAKDEAEEFIGRVRDSYKLIPTFDQLDLEYEKNKNISPHRIMLAKLKNKNKLIKGRDAGPNMWWESGSKIISLSAHKGRGKTGNRIIIDEAAHINTKNSHITLDEVFKAIEATVEKAGGQIIVISTANGTSNKFCQMWEDAVSGKSGIFPFFFDCWSDPTFTK